MIQRFDNFRSGPPTARKPGSKQSPLLAGLREKAQRLLAGLGSDSTFTAGTAPAIPEKNTMSETHNETARRIHAAACPSIALSDKPMDSATAAVAARSWRKYHSSHASEMTALGVTADELCSFLRLELAEVSR